jgi:O-antigen/teichoic acid export membrane protein
MKRFTLDFSGIKEFLRETLSPGISQLINESFSAVSNALAKAFSTFSGVGIFSLADKISSVFVLVSFTIFTVLLPKNAIRKRERQGYDYMETIILSIGVLLLAFFTIIFARFFIPWFFENKYDQSLEILNVMVFAGAITAIHTFMENYFFVENKTNYLAFISGGKLALLIILSLILIPIFSLNGLAWANFIAAGVTLGVVSALIFSETD